jgi:hypothetical protein
LLEYAGRHIRIADPIIKYANLCCLSDNRERWSIVVSRLLPFSSFGWFIGGGWRGVRALWGLVAASSAVVGGRGRGVFLGDVIAGPGSFLPMVMRFMTSDGITY